MRTISHRLYSLCKKVIFQLYIIFMKVNKYINNNVIKEYSQCVVICTGILRRHSQCVVICTGVELEYSQCVVICTGILRRHSQCVVICTGVELEYSQCVVICTGIYPTSYPTSYLNYILYGPNAYALGPLILF